ncbi:hypothetical protein IMZ16_04220 [Cruoricaptor ignavus]|uniref:Uncharacterized protein n=1 Tax=Cruoricaptor ignavus TaxID=1118202 RepID=A0A7M1T440_9FLAO|nr:hypothetical protein [Cruoricaptor ignavus]QOR74646.1 hypothetical protein IMZ16_04220 [Cruoricaptor ignavus]
MRKFIAIFFLSVYLLAFTEARQLLKLPDLVGHYITHKHEDPGTSFYSFLRMHYLESHGKNTDPENHTKLPFKMHDLAFAPASIIPPAKEFSLLPKPVIPQDRNYSIFYIEPFSDEYLSSVFRPPSIG